MLIIAWLLDSVVRNVF